MIPLFAPDGSMGYVPYEKVNDAIKAGGTIARKMQAPNGDVGYIPASKASDAVKAGGKVLPYDAEEANGGQEKGFWNAYSSDFSYPSAQNPYPGMGVEAKQAAAEQSGAADARRKAQGAGLVYRTAAAAVSPIANVEGMEQAAEQGDTSGVIGHMAAGQTMAASPLIAEGAVRGVKAAVPAGWESATNALRPRIFTPEGGLTPWADAITHPTKIPEQLLKTVIKEDPAAVAARNESAAYEQKAQDLTRRGREQAALDMKAAREAKATAKNVPKPNPPSPFAGMTSSATPIGKAELPAVPQGNPTPFPTVAKAGQQAPKSLIVEPGSKPPDLKVTYQSYPRSVLYEMAKSGDIEAGKELLRNPAGFSLPPNFKYLIEESDKMPWRNRTK